MAPATGDSRPGLVIHPFFFALSPILFLYVHNLAQIPVAFGEFVLPAAIALLASIILWLLLTGVLRDRAKAGLLVTLVVILAFSYGHVFVALDAMRLRAGSLLMVWLLLFVVGAWLILRTRGSLRRTTTILNAVAVAFVVTNAGAGLLALARKGKETQGLKDSDFSRELRNPGRVAARDVKSSEPALPDIYYVVLDGYGRSDLLKSSYGYDNSDFVDFLADNGFYVVPRARSNYAQTYLSLASSLNSAYLDDVAAQEGLESEDRGPLIRMLDHSRVAEFLKRRGYTVVSFSSGATATDLKDASVHLGPRWTLTEFQNELVATTIIPSLLDLVVHRSQEDLHRERIRYALENLPGAARGRHPAFVFAHIMCPHEPFVFDADGKPVKTAGYFRLNPLSATGKNSSQRVSKRYEENYGPQVTYLTRQVKTMVEQTLAESPTSPVIILQGDHAPGGMNLTGLDPDQLLKRHAILNAIRLPQSSAGAAFEYDSLYDSITPVNTFRILLNRLFGADIALLPDKSYFSTLETPYRFYDVSGAESAQPPVRNEP